MELIRNLGSRKDKNNRVFQMNYYQTIIRDKYE